MSLEDKQKWDKKYIDKKRLLEPREASQNLKNYHDKCGGKKALELACGSGRNTIYLAQNGFTVDALDIAKIALDTLDNYAHELGLDNNINTKLVDLDANTFEKESYDLVVMTNFLDRVLITDVKTSLKVGGVFFIETYMQDSSNNKPNSNQDYLLKSDELKEIFKDYEIIYYNEFDNEPTEMYQMRKQVVVAKKSI
jgi:2-polyprenyl-3-methyl-5-hydroxy-6-metoxy-1,4-benzoquinol methylase